MNVLRMLVMFGLVLSVLNCNSCTKTNAKEMAIAYIKGDLTKSLGLGALSDISCDTPPDSPKVGETFKCTAKTSDGKLLNIVSTFTQKDKVDLRATNILQKEAIQKILAGTIPAVKEQAGQDVETGNVDCGTNNIVLDQQNTFQCVVTLPSTGQKHKVNFTLDTASNSVSVKVDMPPPAEGANPEEGSNDEPEPEAEEDMGEEEGQ